MVFSAPAFDKRHPANKIQYILQRQKYPLAAGTFQPVAEQMEWLP